MASQVPRCTGILLLLLCIQGQGGAKPLAELQTLSRWLEEEPEQPTVSGETEPEQIAEDLMPGALDQQDLLFPWAQSPWEDGPFQRFLSDLLSSTRRFRARRKKGLLRGCFGVKLDRIGTWSGLGC